MPIVRQKSAYIYTYISIFHSLSPWRALKINIILILYFRELYLLTQKLLIWVCIVCWLASTMVSLTLNSAVAIRYLMFHEKIWNFENVLLATSLTYFTNCSYVAFSNILLLLPSSENCAVSRLCNSLLSVSIAWPLGRKISINIGNAWTI